MPSVNSLPTNLRQALSLLGLEWPTTEEALGSAFRKAALLAHPDRGGSEEEMKKVNAAHELIEKTLSSGAYRQSDPNDWSDGWYTGSWTNSAWEFSSTHKNYHRTYSYNSGRTSTGSGKAEKHTYVPPKDFKEALRRATDLSYEGFCTLEWWQVSKTNPNNITRVFPRIGGLRCTIYFKDGEYGWVASLEGLEPNYSKGRFRSRKLAVEDLADTMDLKGLEEEVK